MSVRQDRVHADAPAEAAAEGQSALVSLWRNNKGVILILMAEVVGSCMDAIVRFLQQGEQRMHAFQVIFARMSVTFVLSTIYLWWKGVADFPLGAPAVRCWLVLRALFGFSGLFCLYYSVHYLPLAEATVFRFLVPILTAWACSVFLGQKFTRGEFFAGLLALLGVVIIAHPAAIFGKVEGSDGDVDALGAGQIDVVTPAQRLIAIIVSVVGVVGAAGAYTMIRVIGNRAHALMSVNYFAALSSVGSAVALLVMPAIGFTMPRGVREWVLLGLLGVLGFVLQFLLTAGLQLDRSSKATSMLYSQVLFALAFDWAIWGVLPGTWSCVGGAIVIASTLWSALRKPTKVTAEEQKSAIVDEESALLGAQTEGIEETIIRSESTSSEDVHRSH